MPYFNDDGNELNPDLIPKPHLCVGCRKDDMDDQDERVLCDLTRLDQSGEKDFICHGFVPKE
jgi:hypothetical protein